MRPGIELRPILYLSSLLLLCQVSDSTPSATEVRQIEDDERGLDPKQESIVAIAAYTAIGDLDCLRTELRLGLQAVLSVQEAREVLLLSFPFCGYPRSLNGLDVLSEVVGKCFQGELDTLGNLDNKTRELVAVSLLAAMNDTEPQLKAHFKQALSVGLSVLELKSFVKFLGEVLGESKARDTATILIEAQEAMKGSQQC